MEQEAIGKMKHHPAILSRDNTALIIVDVQEKLLPYVLDKEMVLENLKMLIRFAHIMNIPLVLTEHYPKGLGTTVPEIKEVLSEYKPKEKVIFSCLGSEGFENKLKELDVKRLMIAGIESHICVQQTALDSLDLGYEVHVIADAISSRTQRNLDIGIEKMRQFGAVISSTEMAMYEIMERADTKEFKEVLKLVK
ncbi:MAG: hydrolase [Methanomassiliicoccales archaeon]|nr:MAG: hydrolase [Methanomassiliicoccales archaeon]